MCVSDAAWAYGGAFFIGASSFSGGRGLPPVHSAMPVRIAVRSTADPLIRYSSSLQVIAGGVFAARSLARSTMAAKPRLSASSTRSRNLWLCEFGVFIASQKYVRASCRDT
jgi:hypothetical protein